MKKKNCKDYKKEYQKNKMHSSNQLNEAEMVISNMNKVRKLKYNFNSNKFDK